MSFFAEPSNESLRNKLRILLIVFLGAIVTYIVFMTGGTKSSWAQLYYIAILLSAHYWKAKGGVICALALGLIAGPFMPLDVSQGIMQTPENWIIRILIYISIGFISGYIIQKNNELNNRMREKDFMSKYTGLYNTNKLFLELNKMIENDKKFCLVFFDVRNLGEISKYVKYDIIKDIINCLISEIKSKFQGNDLYSNNFNEFILVLKEYEEQDINQVITKKLEEFVNTVKIDGYSFHLIVKVGIACSNDENIKAVDIFNKARIASDQGENSLSSVYTYDSNFNEEMKLFYEISGSFQDAINNNEFYLVYQPIINLNNNSISDVEVLVRWNRGEREPIGPGTFVKIAEEIGFIQNITLEIAKQHSKQLVNWKNKGIDIKSSINCTALEIIDESLGERIKEIIDSNNIDRSNLVIEITERVFNLDEKKLNYALSNLKNKGYSISIDDFGTGYNTLKNLENIKAQVIKIDKYFIDLIEQKNGNSIVKHLIELIHEMGMLVVAEGVEKKEQLIILKEMGCDMIQGYYFSKPILPDDFAEYYKSFDINRYI